ncbi:MAG: hypothetical protein ACI84C_001420 [Flavobacteriales bacterium]|jgi:hypothetical protein
MKSPKFQQSNSIAKARCLLSLGLFVGLGLMSLSVFSQTSQAFKGNSSMPYAKLIKEYAALDSSHAEARLVEFGQSDVGEPLHLFVINGDENFDLDQLSNSKVVLLINNGIHPGEPCGVDASFKLANNLLSGKKEYSALLENVVVCIIPMYNIGGALNRGCCSRANQNGPDEYGFRGNARNLDLNRDFVKCDSENAKSFNKMMSSLSPHLFIDTHTSNGADYQYVMTMIATQPDKATSILGQYIRDEINPAVYEKMKSSGWEMTPYVNSMGKTPNSGIVDFLETPRYSTGYASLHNCIGFTSETHMFKPFEQRVESTYQFELALLAYANDQADAIQLLKIKADLAVSNQQEFALQWGLDSTQWQNLDFKGYEAEYLPSAVTGKERLFYNREKPVNVDVKYFDHYKPMISVTAPDYYVIPQAWKEVIERLSWNQVEMTRLQENKDLLVGTYHIVDYQSKDKPYEGHYLHHSVEVEKTKEQVSFRKGDYLVKVDQKMNRYIVETLEPQSVDSYFAWNFFDSILQQKEWFSDYVFEDQAEKMLGSDEQLRAEFTDKKQNDVEFSESHWWQLYWLYQRSENYENTFNRYPIYRIVDGSILK